MMQDRVRGPGVVLFPEAFGIGDIVTERARRLAALGYVALAADPYGDGRRRRTCPRRWSS